MKFIQTTPVVNSRVVFTSKPNPILPSGQVIQQPPQTLIQRSLPSQNVSYVPQGYVPVRPQGLPEVANQQLPSIIQVQQPQSIILNNQRTIVSQPPVNSFNPPTQVMQQAVLNEQKDDSRLQQQRIISQNIELKEEIKPVETKNTSVPTIQTNGYKTYETNSR